MKQLEFETSKGRFLLIDSEDAPSSFNRYLRDIEKKLGVQLIIGYKLSEITEEQASEIVDEPFGLEVGDDEVIVFKDYEDDENTYTSSIDSLHSLLFSKGIHLFKSPFNIENCFEPNYYEKKLQAEEKTFYNPYIFKL